MLNKIIALLQSVLHSRIGMNYIWVFLGQNVGAIFSMLTLILTLRVIKTCDYGILVIIQTYCLLISNIFCLRTFNGVIKFVSDAEVKKETVRIKKYITSGLILDLIAGIVSYVAGFFLLNTVTALMGWDIGTVKYVFSYLPVTLFYPILNGTPVGILRKLGFFKQVNMIHAFVFGLQTVVLAITWIAKIDSFQIIVVEYVITEILECVLLFVYSIYILQRKSAYSYFWKAGVSKDYEFLKYNIFYGLSTTFDQILGNVSTLLINKYIGNFATAYIKVITKICSLFMKLSNPISQVIYPELCDWVARKKYNKALRISMKYFYIVLGAGTLVLVILMITFNWWISIFDPSMINAKVQSMLYMIYTLLSVAIICMSQLTFALNLVKQNLYLVMVINIIYIICLIPVIQIWGIYGYLFLQIIQLLCVFSGKYLFVRIRIKKLMKEDVKKG